MHTSTSHVRTQVRLPCTLQGGLDVRITRIVTTPCTPTFIFHFHFLASNVWRPTEITRKTSLQFNLSRAVFTLPAHTGIASSTGVLFVTVNTCVMSTCTPFPYLMVFGWCWCRLLSATDRLVVAPCAEALAQTLPSTTGRVVVGKRGEVYSVGARVQQQGVGLLQQCC